MDPILTIGPENGFGFYLASAVVMIVNLVKTGIMKWGGKKAKKIPSWLWIGLSIIIAEAICIFLKVDILSSILGQNTPFTGVAANLLSGGVISLSSNVLYKVAVKPPEETVPMPTPVPVQPAPVVIPEPTLEYTELEAYAQEIEELPVVFLTQQPLNSTRPVYVLIDNSRVIKIKVREEDD